MPKTYERFKNCGMYFFGKFSDSNKELAMGQNNFTTCFGKEKRVYHSYFVEFIQQVFPLFNSELVEDGFFPARGFWMFLSILCRGYNSRLSTFCPIQTMKFATAKGTHKGKPVNFVQFQVDINSLVGMVRMFNPGHGQKLRKAIYIRNQNYDDVAVSKTKQSGQKEPHAGQSGGENQAASVETKTPTSTDPKSCSFGIILARVEKQVKSRVLLTTDGIEIGSDNKDGEIVNSYKNASEREERLVVGENKKEGPEYLGGEGSVTVMKTLLAQSPMFLPILFLEMALMHPPKEPTKKKKTQKEVTDFSSDAVVSFVSQPRHVNNRSIKSYRVLVSKESASQDRGLLNNLLSGDDKVGNCNYHVVFYENDFSPNITQEEVNLGTGKGEDKEKGSDSDTSSEEGKKSESEQMGASDPTRDGKHFLDSVFFERIGGSVDQKIFPKTITLETVRSLWSTLTGQPWNVTFEFSTECKDLSPQAKTIIALGAVLKKLKAIFSATGFEDPYLFLSGVLHYLQRRFMYALHMTEMGKKMLPLKRPKNFDGLVSAIRLYARNLFSRVSIMYMDGSTRTASGVSVLHGLLPECEVYDKKLLAPLESALMTKEKKKFVLERSFIYEVYQLQSKAAESESVSRQFEASECAKLHALSMKIQMQNKHESKIGANDTLSNIFMHFVNDRQLAWESLCFTVMADKQLSEQEIKAADSLKLKVSKKVTLGNRIRIQMAMACAAILPLIQKVKSEIPQMEKLEKSKYEDIYRSLSRSFDLAVPQKSWHQICMLVFPISCLLFLEPSDLNQLETLKNAFLVDGEKNKEIRASHPFHTCGFKSWFDFKNKRPVEIAWGDEVRLTEMMVSYILSSVRRPSWKFR